jgi:tungstate transport system permease protein
MDLIWQGVRQAFELLFGGDANVFQVALRSLWVSGLALLIAAALGVPLGAALALNRFPGRRLAIAFVNSGMGVPPVVVGLAVAMVLARSGPLGLFRLLYTPSAMVVAQVLIALPIVAGLALAALQQLDDGYRLQITALGAGPVRTVLLLLREVRISLMAALMAAFGGVISEVGAVMMVGGNIEGQTQVLTTGIVQQTRAGQYSAAIALSVILLVLVFATNFAMTLVQQRSRRA